MEIDARLLEEAQAARMRLVALEHEAENRRLAYYQAVRRLHSAGASMRDIAESLQLSHQRVHQIVNGSGQTAPAKEGKHLLERLARRSEKTSVPGQKLNGPGKLLLDHFSTDARASMVLAEEEARALGHREIGTEHLLLGLLRSEHGLAGRILVALGIDLEQTRTAIEALVGRGEGIETDPLPLTARVQKALELAHQEAKSFHSIHVRSEHVLLGIAREGGGLAAQELADRGAGYERLRRRVNRAALTCSFCGRRGFDVAHLIAGPDVAICDLCTEDATGFAGEGIGEKIGARLSIVAGTAVAACSFCNIQQAEGDRLIRGPEALICTDCLTIAREILEEERLAVIPKRG